jgi:hypothetical protein
VDSSLDVWVCGRSRRVYGSHVEGEGQASRIVKSLRESANRRCRSTGGLEEQGVRRHAADEDDVHRRDDADVLRDAGGLTADDALRSCRRQ